MQDNRATWRLIDTGPLGGAANMAVDEALLLSFDPERSAPVLRIYGWDPPALSLGRFQKAAKVLDLSACAAAGVPVVRRITGGGVIFHADELTYSAVCAPSHLPPVPTVRESFRVLTSFLLRFYERLGLSVCYAVDAAPSCARLGEQSDFCFAGKESYDILIDGRKIGGNAQRRLRNVIFQHGSIPLANCAAYGAGFLRELISGMGEAAGALADFGVGLAPGELKKLMAEAFVDTFSAVLVEDRLTTKEEESAAFLHRRHSDPSWVGDGETGKG